MLPRLREQTDPIYLWVDAADGPVLIEHTPEEYERLWRGVDREVCAALSKESGDEGEA